MLDILTSIWVLQTTNAGRNMLFHIFCTKNVTKEEKQENWVKIKKKVFLSLHPQVLIEVFVPRNLKNLQKPKCYRHSAFWPASKCWSKYTTNISIMPLLIDWKNSIFLAFKDIPLQSYFQSKTLSFFTKWHFMWVRQRFSNRIPGNPWFRPTGVLKYSWEWSILKFLRVFMYKLARKEYNLFWTPPDSNSCRRNSNSQKRFQKQYWKL